MKLISCVQLCKNRNPLIAKISNIFKAMIVNITPAFTIILHLRVQIIFNIARKNPSRSMKTKLAVSFANSLIIHKENTKEINI